MAKRGFNGRLREFLRSEKVDTARIDAIEEEFFPAHRAPRPMSSTTLEGLGRLQCTNAEIAAYFDLTERQIESRRAKDSDLDAAIRKGQQEGKISLRRAQWANALDGDRTMQIWLGKNHLGQRDEGMMHVQGTLSLDDVDIRPIIDRKLEEFVKSKSAPSESDTENTVH